MALRMRNWASMNLEFLAMALRRECRPLLIIPDSVLRNDPVPEVDWEVFKRIPFWVVRVRKGSPSRDPMSWDEDDRALTPKTD